MLETFSPILDALEDGLTGKLGRPVAISLRMFSNYKPLLQAMQSNQFSFARMGPASYIDLLERGNGISLLAMQQHTDQSLVLTTIWTPLLLRAWQRLMDARWITKPSPTFAPKPFVG